MKRSRFAQTEKGSPRLRESRRALFNSLFGRHFNGERKKAIGQGGTPSSDAALSSIR